MIPKSQADKEFKILTIGRWLGLPNEFIAQYLVFTYPRYNSKFKFSLEECLGWNAMDKTARRLQFHMYIFENINAETVADLYYLSYDDPEFVFLVMVIMILIEDDKYEKAVMQFLDLIDEPNLIHYFTHYFHVNSLEYQNGINVFKCYQCNNCWEIGGVRAPFNSDNYKIGYT